MLRVPLCQAKAGMKLAMPVMHKDRPDTLLLRAGYTLDDRALARLAEMRLPEIWVQYPPLEFIEKHISPHIMQCRGELQRAIAGLIDRLEKDAAANIDYPTYKQTIRDFVQKLIDEPDAAMFITEMSSGNSPLMRHAADVAFLALLMGMKLDAYLINQRRRLAAHRAKDVVSLGVAALLHDVGMLFVDPAAVENFWATYDESDAEFRKHVVVGYEKVQSGLDPAAANAVLNHHQHFDGTGYPKRKDDKGELRGLKGDQIHVFSRIIAVADLFDRYRNPPGAQKRVPPVVALSKMRVAPAADWIDPTVFKALLAVAPAYPPGTCVTLSNGERCAVVAWSPQDPCRPTVQAMRSDAGDGPTAWDCDEQPTRYALSERRDLTITHVDGEDVHQHNFYPSHDLEFRLETSDTEASAEAA